MLPASKLLGNRWGNKTAAGNRQLNGRYQVGSHSPFHNVARGAERQGGTREIRAPGPASPFTFCVDCSFRRKCLTPVYHSGCLKQATRISPCWGVFPGDGTSDWKKTWESAREPAGLYCHFHDLWHTACTRMFESGTPLTVVATIMGWSPSTTVRMSRRYGHIGLAAQREAVRALEGKEAKIEREFPQNSPQFSEEQTPAFAN